MIKSWATQLKFVVSQRALARFIDLPKLTVCVTCMFVALCLFHGSSKGSLAQTAFDRHESERSDKFTGGRLERVDFEPDQPDIRITLNVPSFRLTLWQNDKEVKSYIYFAHPYASWERGLNENTNGLVRQYFPKKYDFAKISDQDLQQVEDLLNNRPRKTLGYRTPNEVFFKQRSVALRS